MFAISYLQAGEYLIPDLTLPSQPELNKYGRMRKSFLKENRENLYTSLLMSGELMEHLHQTGLTTKKQVEQVIKGLEKKNPPPEKAQNSTQWVRYMEMLRREAEELVFPETIYV